MAAAAAGGERHPAGAQVLPLGGGVLHLPGRLHVQMHRMQLPVSRWAQIRLGGHLIEKYVPTQVIWHGLEAVAEYQTGAAEYYLDGQQVSKEEAHQFAARWWQEAGLPPSLPLDHPEV